MNTVTERDLGWGLFKQRVAKAQGAFVVVGVQQGTQREDPNDPSMAQVAADNEFGTKTIPSRSFLRSTFDETEKSMRRRVKKEYEAYTKGEQSIETAMGRVGEDFQAKVQKKIRSNVPPENAPETLARKLAKDAKGTTGAPVTLIDTGQLHRSIRYVVKVPGRG